MAKGYKFTDEQRARLSAAHKARVWTPEELAAQSERMRAVMTGRKWSEERKAAASARNKGQQPSQACRDAGVAALTGVKWDEERRAKHREVFKGRKPEAAIAANTGRKRPPEECAKISAYHKGRPKPEHVLEALRQANVNRVYTDEHRAKISAGLKEHAVSDVSIQSLRARNLGKPKTPEQRAKLSEKLKGRTISEVQKAAISVASKKNWADPAYREKVTARLNSPEVKAKAKAQQQANLTKIRDGRSRWMRETKLEQAVKAVLIEMGLEFEQSKPFCWYEVDFYLPAFNLVLECDGEYWHSLPKAQKNDLKRDKWFRGQGYRVARIPERAIKSDCAAAVRSAVYGSVNDPP